MNSRLKLRLEAARIAAQLSPASGTELVKQAKTIEKYILGKAELPEYISIEETVKMNIEEGMNAILKKEKADIADLGRRLDESYDLCLKRHIESGTSPVPESWTNNPLFGTDKQMHLQDNVELNQFLPDPVLAVNHQHDPAFVSDLMNTFANYPATKEDFDQAVRRRHELYHDLGLEPEPFDKRHPHPPCDTGQETVYLAPGGMPSSEAESIYLTPPDLP